MTAWHDKSESIDALAPSLVQALGEMNEVARTRQANAGSYQYRYADLADALGMARPILAEHGLALTQTAEATDDQVVIWTTIVHSSGQFVTYAPTRLPAGKTAQNTGSAITYARRYALMAVLGLATEDDDGATASPRPEKAAVAPVKKSTAPRSHEEQEIRRLLATLTSTESAKVRGEFKAKFGCGLMDLDVSKHEEALEWVTMQQPVMESFSLEDDAPATLIDVESD